MQLNIETMEIGRLATCRPSNLLLYYTLRLIEIVWQEKIRCGYIWYVTERRK